ncbi:MAG TPA: exodeoxyribonuclease III [bacterium]|nr:exodeoxyribonuclease III [bacterium]
MLLLSWNVNGLRAVHKKGFVDWVGTASPDILCLQETKASEDQLPADLRPLAGYHTHYAAAEKKGYSGVALYSRQQPVGVSAGLGDPAFDREGRTLIADYGEYLVASVYFPNGKGSPERLQYKLAFYDAFLDRMEHARRRGKHIIFCGDVNTAHRPIDLARPKENETVSGFLPAERAWLDRVIAAGYCDTLRALDDRPQLYSWWDLKSGARARNVGWRIDYFFIDAGLRHKLKRAFIMPEVQGSDHCPVGIELAR